MSTPTLEQKPTPRSPFASTGTTPTRPEPEHVTTKDEGVGVGIHLSGGGANTSGASSLFEGMYDGEPVPRSAPRGAGARHVHPLRHDRAGHAVTNGPFDWLADGAPAADQPGVAATTPGLAIATTPEQAVAAMNALKTLPAERQGEAIEKMSPEAFQALLVKVPETLREQFKTLMNNTQDSERKLRLFAEYHKSKASNEATRENQDENPGRSHGGESQAAQRRSKARDEIVKNTKEEVDAEVPFLLQKAKDGKLSAEEIRKYIENKEREHSDEMETLQNHIGTMEGLSDEDRLNYTKSRVETKLETGLFNPVTDQEAGFALKAAKTLPPQLQGKLVERMDKGAFERFLDNVPSAEQEQLDTLFQNTHDPERKLKLWRGYHKAKVKSDAAKEREKTKDEGRWNSRTEAQRQNKRLNDRRDDIVSSTQGEVDDETQHLLKKQQHGHLAEADVDALIKRKEHEHRIEMKYNVNMANDRLLRKDGSKVAWSDEELTAVESGLMRMPEEHVRGNNRLQEIRRSSIATRLLQEKPDIGGDHTSGRIRLYDASITDRYRHTDDTDPRADHYAGRETPRGPVTPLEEVMTHEVGHDVEDIVRGQKSDAVQRFYAAAGWQHLGKRQVVAQLVASGMTAQEAEQAVKGLDKDRAKSFTAQTPCQQGNTVFEVDPYSGGYLSFDHRAMPKEDRWSYARSNPADHFAEFYASAVHTPTILHHDMIDAPNADVAAKAQELSQSQARLAAATTSAARAEAQEKLAEAQRQLTDAQAKQASRRTQWSIMRNEIFHTDTAAAHAKDRLHAFANTPARQQRLAAFEAAAEKAATPQQVEKLRAEAEAAMESLP